MCFFVMDGKRVTRVEGSGKNNCVGMVGCAETDRQPVKIVLFCFQKDIFSDKKMIFWSGVDFVEFDQRKRVWKYGSKKSEKNGMNAIFWTTYILWKNDFFL